MGDLADLFPVVDNGDSPKWILKKIRAARMMSRPSITRRLL